jgi:tRNA A37 methylthiotransferase MiaB
VPAARVLSEIERAADAGFKEVALTGVHLGSYGRDLDPPSSLIELLRAIERRHSLKTVPYATQTRHASDIDAPDVVETDTPNALSTPSGSDVLSVANRSDVLNVANRTDVLNIANGRGRSSDRPGPKVRFRISSLEPMDCSRDVVDLVASCDTFAPHFHLPLQHASDRLLTAMRRPYTLTYYADLVDAIRDRRPNASIGSDVIVGFPGETDEDFTRLCDYLARSPLTHLHVFPYSDRPGTVASAMSGKVNGAVIRERASRVREIGRRLSVRFRESQLGTSHRGLTIEDGTLVVTGNYLKVRIPPGYSRNEWITVKVTGTADVMTGEVLEVLV